MSNDIFSLRITLEYLAAEQQWSSLILRQYRAKKADKNIDRLQVGYCCLKNARDKPKRRMRKYT